MRTVISLAVAMAICSQAARASGDEKRPVPDYDGRGRDSPSAIVWVPRVLLSPVYVLTEFGVRRPLAVIVPAAERADLPRKVYDFFVFGPDHQAGIVPAGFISFGFQPSVGAYALSDNSLFVKQTALRLHLEIWPSNWFYGSLTERIRFADRHGLRFRVSAGRRPDRVFYGIGPDSRQSNQSRYTEARFDASSTLEIGLGGSSNVKATLGVRKVDTTNGDMRPDPTVSESVAAGWFPAPHGFERGYTAGWARLSGTFDTRQHVLQSSGARAEIYAESASDVKTGASWLRYGASATGALDLTGRRGVMSISVATISVDGAAIGTLRYDWPIGPYLGGTLQAAVGNVFGTHLEQLRPELFRLSMVAGISIRGNEPPVEMIFGFGTDTFERGATVDSARFSIGVPHDFF